MFVIYEEIRLDPAGKRIPVIDDDWVFNPKADTLHHLPTQTLFSIRMDEKGMESGPLTAMDFSAHLIAIQRRCVLPLPEVIQELGRAALALYFVAMGFIAPGEPSDANLPAEAKQGYVC